MNDWVLMSEELPLFDVMCVFHIPLRGYPSAVFSGYISNSDGSICNEWGNDIGYDQSDIARWMYFD